MKDRPAARTAVLRYPSHWFKPEELLLFVELGPFARRWNELGLKDEDLALLQVAIMVAPKGAAVIRGTGGLRKLRFAPQGWRVGKSGALRACYLYIEEISTVVLALIYSKEEKDNLSPVDRKVLKGLVDRITRKLLRTSYRCSTTKPGSAPNQEG
jgi:hypothetical protein